MALCATLIAAKAHRSGCQNVCLPNIPRWKAARDTKKQKATQVAICFEPALKKAPTDSLQLVDQLRV
jgi:DsbC/DsbD-like thiol-disulfide interchange protein